MKTNTVYNEAANAHNFQAAKTPKGNSDEMNLLFPLPHIRQQMPKVSVNAENLPNIDLNSTDFLFPEDNSRIA